MGPTKITAKQLYKLMILAERFGSDMGEIDGCLQGMILDYQNTENITFRPNPYDRNAEGNTLTFCILPDGSAHS